MRLITALYLAALILFGAVLLFSDALLVAQTGSMMPAFDPGDLLVTAAPNRALVAGDIISFQMEGKLVTHRVVAVREDGIHSKGDFNHEADPLDRAAQRREARLPDAYPLRRLRVGLHPHARRLVSRGDPARRPVDPGRSGQHRARAVAQAARGGDGMNRAFFTAIALLALAGCVALALGVGGTSAQFYAVTDGEMRVSIASPSPTMTPTPTFTPRPTFTPVLVYLADLPTAPPGASPTPTRPPIPAELKGEILFLSDMGGAEHVYALDPETARLGRLTDRWPYDEAATREAATREAVSADGLLRAFSQRDNNGRVQVWYRDAQYDAVK